MCSCVRRVTELVLSTSCASFHVECVLVPQREHAWSGIVEELSRMPVALATLRRLHVATGREGAQLHDSRSRDTAHRAPVLARDVGSDDRRARDALRSLASRDPLTLDTKNPLLDIREQGVLWLDRVASYLQSASCMVMYS